MPETKPPDLKDDRSELPDRSTPGRPKESGSRQQTHPDQNSHSGSPPFDKEASERGGPPTRPPK
jgi:hypothetical protein